MGEGIIDKVVNILNDKKYITSEGLAKMLGLDVREINMLLGILLAEGIVEEVKTPPTCSSCYFKTSCSMVGNCSTVRIFRLRINRFSK